jgi:hypothetical protein
MLELADTMGQRIVLPIGRARQRSERFNPSLAQIEEREKNLKPQNYVNSYSGSEFDCSSPRDFCPSCNAYPSCPALKI